MNSIFLSIFGGILTIVGYLILNLFYTYKQFHFKQFSQALVHFFSLQFINIKIVLFQTIQYTV